MAGCSRDGWLCPLVLCQRILGSAANDRPVMAPKLGKYQKTKKQLAMLIYISQKPFQFGVCKLIWAMPHLIFFIYLLGNMYSLQLAIQPCWYCSDFGFFDQHDVWIEQLGGIPIPSIMPSVSQNILALVYTSMVGIASLCTFSWRCHI